MLESIPELRQNIRVYAQLVAVGCEGGGCVRVLLCLREEFGRYGIAPY